MEENRHDAILTHSHTRGRGQTRDADESDADSAAGPGRCSCCREWSANRRTHKTNITADKQRTQTHKQKRTNRGRRDKAAESAAAAAAGVGATSRTMRVCRGGQSRAEEAYRRDATSLSNSRVSHLTCSCRAESISHRHAELKEARRVTAEISRRACRTPPPSPSSEQSRLHTQMQERRE